MCECYLTTDRNILLWTMHSPLKPRLLHIDNNIFYFIWNLAHFICIIMSLYLVVVVEGHGFIVVLYLVVVVKCNGFIPAAKIWVICKSVEIVLSIISSCAGDKNTIMKSFPFCLVKSPIKLLMLTTLRSASWASRHITTLLRTSLYPARNSRERRMWGF